MKTKIWLKGLMSAFIGGAATAFCAMQIAPETFNINAQWHNLVKLVLFAGLTHAAFYLKKSPLPGEEDSPNGQNNISCLLPFLAALSLGLFGCVTTDDNGNLVEAKTTEQKAKAAARWVNEASGLLQAGVATAVQIGVYSANKDNAEETAAINSVLHTVSTNLALLLEQGKTDPESVRLALKIKEPYFAPIFLAVGNLYSSQFARFQKNGYTDLVIELLKALSRGVADGSA